MIGKNFKQGVYKIRNREKYVGNHEPVYRSSWEKKTMEFFDGNKAILKWSSEGTVVPYFSPLDKKVHRYFVDFTILYEDAEGNRHKALIEVKPFKETKEPEKPKKLTGKAKKNYLLEATTYITNQAKWDAAKAFAAKHGMRFLVITENELGIKRG